MTRMSALLASLLLAFTFAAAQTASSKPEVNSDSNTEKEFKALVREMHNVLLGCDKDRLFSFFADDFIGTSYDGFTVTKEELIKVFQCPPAEARVVREIEDFKIRNAGDTVIVSYRLIEGSETESKRSYREFLYTDTFVTRIGRWQMISSHATRVLPERKVTKIDYEVFDDYVGKYGSDPTSLFAITREGDKLLGRAPDGETVELLPENETTFFLEKHNVQVIFERGKTGQVMRMVIKRGSGDVRLERVNEAKIP